MNVGGGGGAGVGGDVVGVTGDVVGGPSGPSSSAAEAAPAGSGSATGSFGPEGPPTVGPSTAQAAISDSVRMSMTVRVLVVTDSDTEDINLRGTQATAKHVQLIEVICRTDVNAMVVAVVDLHPLDM